MKRVRLFLFPLLSVFLLAGCNNGKYSPKEYMVFDEIEYVDGFPDVYKLSGKPMADIGLMGVRDFRIVDSMLVFSLRGNDSLWSFYSLPEYRLLGRCFTKGSGPDEFVDLPETAFKTDFFREGADWFACIYEFPTGRLKKANISSLLRGEGDAVTSLCDTFPPSLFNFITIDDSTFFCKEMDYSRTRQLRYLQTASGRIVPSSMRRLNEASVDNPEDFNILSTITKMHHPTRTVVEMPIGLNSINMYSLSADSLAKTICVGTEPDNVEAVEAQDRWKRLYTFADVRLFDRFWGVLSLQEDMKTYQVGRTKYPSVLLFDWEGHPLCEVKLDHFATSFDVDVRNCTLYTFDVQTDEMYVYDVSEVLAGLK